MAENTHNKKAQQSNAIAEQPQEGEHKKKGATQSGEPDSTDQGATKPADITPSQPDSPPPPEPDAEEEKEEETKPIKLYKSSRLKGYLTLVLASIINYDAAQKSDNVISGSNVIPSTTGQKNYAISVAVVSLVVTGATTLMHLDTVTFLQNAWISAFKPKSRIELGIAIFLVIWWSVATGVQTSIRGVAGDGKGQYSLYFSSWGCCFASYWVLERWWVAAGLASLKAFITSWPYRSPGWLCIFFMSVFTLIWYLDLWKSYPRLNRSLEQEVQLKQHFDDVQDLQWQLIVSLIVFTVLPAAAFVLAEIFRQTKPDGSNEEKSKPENMAEGITLLGLILAWIPSIIWVTAPDGAASLVGNAYFSSWLLVIFVAETGVWFVHDLRERIHQSLEQKQLEYREKQRQVVEKAHAIQQQKTQPRQQDAKPPGAREAITVEEDAHTGNGDDDDDDDVSSDDDYADALTDF